MSRMEPLRKGAFLRMKQMQRDGFAPVLYAGRKLDQIGVDTVGNPMAVVIEKMVGETGIEPVTPGLEGRCSIQLSYSPAVAACFIVIGVAASRALLKMARAASSVRPHAATYRVNANPSCSSTIAGRITNSTRLCVNSTPRNSSTIDRARTSCAGKDVNRDSSRAMMSM